MLSNVSYPHNCYVDLSAMANCYSVFLGFGDITHGDSDCKPTCSVSNEINRKHSRTKDGVGVLYLGSPVNWIETFELNLWERTLFNPNLTGFEAGGVLINSPLNMQASEHSVLH
jgi:hypothetical protein